MWTNAAELPRFVYDVPEKVVLLVNDDAAYRRLRQKFATSKAFLRNYEIKDRDNNAQTNLQNACHRFAGQKWIQAESV